MQHSQSKRRTTFTQQPAPCLKLLYLIYSTTPPHPYHPGSHSHIPSRHPQRPWLRPSLVQALLCGFILDASLVMRLLRRCCRPDCCAGCGASAPASFLRRADQ